MPVEAPGLLDSGRAEELFNMAQKAAASRGVHDVEIIAGASAEALTRFANNAIHQNVAEQTRHVSVRVIIEGRTARATTNRWDADSIDRAVDEAIHTARCLQADPDLPPLFEPQPVTSVDRYFSATADCTPDDRAWGVSEAIRVVEAAGQTAAGIFSTESHVESILNSRGVFAIHAESMAKFSITAMAADSSGWAKASSPHRGAFDPVRLARRAAHKAAASRAPREIEPGRYTVILEPSAVLDLVGQMFGDFSGTSVQDQRSFLTGRTGERIFGEGISITDDVYHPLQAGAPFDGEGVPRSKLNLVVNGTPSELAFSRTAAARAGVIHSPGRQGRVARMSRVVRRASRPGAGLVIISSSAPHVARKSAR